jgi:phosphoenolpyruvate carboxykinase (GTP)
MKFQNLIIFVEKTTPQGTVVTRDPFAMGDYVGYNIGEYFERWTTLRNSLGFSSPKVYFVNWFKKSADGSYLWPGFGENSYVLRWIHRVRKFL